MNRHLKNISTKNDHTDKTVEESDTDKSVPKRRIQDGISLKKSHRKMNLDRRHDNSERRGNGDPNYKGPSRRYTIDRRLTNKDRRQSD